MFETTAKKHKIAKTHYSTGAFSVRGQVCVGNEHNNHHVQQSPLLKVGPTPTACLRITTSCLKPPQSKKTNRNGTTCTAIVQGDVCLGNKHKNRRAQPSLLSKADVSTTLRARLRLTTSCWNSHTKKKRKKKRKPHRGDCTSNVRGQVRQHDKRNNHHVQ